VLDHAARDALEVSAPVLDGLPAQPEFPRQLGPEGGLVEVAGRLGVPIQLAAVERRPAAIRRPRGVGDDHVRVQQRVAGARGPVPEGRGDEATPRQPDRPRPTATSPARLTLEIPERLTHRLFVRTDDPS
jgi:hypothetical protein